MKKLIDIGKIVNTHGIKGELKIQAWCDSPDMLLDIDKFYLEDEKTVLEPVSARIHKNNVLMFLKGIEDFDSAEALKNKVILADKSYFKLEKNTFFIDDLIGLSVFDIDNEKLYGKITDIFQTGANDVYVVHDDERKEYLIPAIKDCIIETDIKSKVMKIRPLKGLFDE
jgi:16S rRNA processing protein RimM